jgi:nucleoside-diphosphate-sugar epimerase
MDKAVILGCGYTGRVLLRSLLGRARTVVATTTTEGNLAELAALGAEARRVRHDDAAALASALAGAEVVFHLAPPAPYPDLAAQARAIAAALGPELRAYVYGSTTGAFGGHAPGVWIDETTPPGALGERGRVRLLHEQALAAAGLPLRVVRIAGIYGPGRTLRGALESGELLLFRDGPPTSRTHVEDLARLLEAMARPDAPPLAIACDEDPATTLEVARFTAALLGREAPEPVSLEEARRRLSPAALEMRLGGRQCRSLVRPQLIGDLGYPTYREGVRASLIAEGALSP